MEGGPPRRFDVWLAGVVYTSLLDVTSALGRVGAVM